jgi:hypothetical protein
MPELIHIPGKRPVVLNDGYDPKTPPNPTKQIQIVEPKTKPEGKRK